MEGPTPSLTVDHLLAGARLAGAQDICRRYGVRRLMIFGSSLKGERRPDSDIDLLAEFQPGRTPGFAFARLAEELSLLFGVPVDLHTVASLSKYFRDAVLREAREIYAAEE